MKYFFAAIGILVFAGIITLGAFMMMNHTRCPLTLMGNDCKTNINPLGYALAHIGAIIEITNVIPISGAIATFTFFIIFIYSAVLFDSYNFIFASQKINYYHGETGQPTTKEKFLSWISLHEKRDYSSLIASV